MARNKQSEFLVGLVTIFIVAFILYLTTCNSEEEKLKVENSEWDGSVIQAELYLKKILKDPDSYESIEWGQVIEIIYPSDLLAYAEIEKKTKVYTNYDKKEKDDFVLQPSQTIYIIDRKEDMLKFRTSVKDLGIFGWCNSKGIIENPIDRELRYSVENRYRSKNSFGGYVIEQVKFYLDKNGNVLYTEQIE